MQEVKRVLLALALGFVIAFPLLKWVSPRLFPDVPAAKPVEPEKPVEPPPSDGGPGPNVAPPPVAPQPLPEVSETTRELANDTVRATFTSRGASLLSLVLPQYKERYLPRKEGPQGTLPLELLYEAEAGHRPFLLRILKGEKSPLDERNWEAKSAPGESPVVFEWRDPNTGLTVTKSFRLSSTPYAVEVEVQASSSKEGEYQFELEAQSGIAYESDSGSDPIEGLLARAEIPAAGTGGKGRTITTVKSEANVAKLKKEDVKFGTDDVGAGWIGLANRYFVSVLVPMTDEQGRLPVDRMSFRALTDRKERKLLERYSQAYPQGIQDREKLERERNDQLDQASRINILAAYQTPSVDLSKGPWKLSGTLYAGPKSEKDLKPLAPYGLDKALDFGWWWAVSEILLSILRFFHSICGNWGWSILMLTLAVRLCIFPLNRKAQVSSQKMSKLQPKVQEIRKRYEKNKEQLGQEMMKLYREHGVNPVGGCLPILLQMPVLIGLYRMLSMAIELRQQPFIGWIKDLSQPDMLFEWHFPGLPCFCGGGTLLKTEFFNLLPIIMMATWFIQSLTYPKPADPEMAKQQSMMKWMPLIFGLMMFSTPSGLILYWMTSTFLGIIEQQLIKRVFLPRA